MQHSSLGLAYRYLKQAVVDKSAVVASAVLVSAFHLLSQNNEIVKRWTNEIQEAMQSKHSMVQFHAVALLHALRANDRLAVSKLVSSLVKGSVRSVTYQPMHVALFTSHSMLIAMLASSIGSSHGCIYSVPTRKLRLQGTANTLTTLDGSAVTNTQSASCLDQHVISD